MPAGVPARRSGCLTSCREPWRPTPPSCAWNGLAFLLRNKCHHPNRQLVCIRHVGRDELNSAFPEREQEGRVAGRTVELGDNQGRARARRRHLGTGFNDRTVAQIRERLTPLVTKTPFPTQPDCRRPVTWVRPQVVVEVQYYECGRLLATYISRFFCGFATISIPIR